MSQHQRPTCSYFDDFKCRSCTYMGIPYELTLEKKQGLLEDAFPGKVASSMTGSDHYFGTRIKAKMAVKGNAEDWEIGIENQDYRKGDILECPLHTTNINKVLSFIKGQAPIYKVPPYNVLTKKGEIKYLILFESPTTQEMYVRFVLRSKEALERIKKFSINLQRHFPQIKAVSVNIHPEHKATLEGEEEIILTEEKNIQHQVSGNKLTLAPDCFVQTNNNVAEKLYSTISDLIIKLKSKNILDLYCGIGATTFSYHKFVEAIVALEINPKSIDCAKLSLNSIASNNIQFIASSAESYLANTENIFDTIIVNPPRGGLSKEVREWIKNSKSSNLIYSSCNLTSLKRDLEELNNAYHVQLVKGFDMFPLTSHFETLVLATYKQKK